MLVSDLDGDDFSFDPDVVLILVLVDVGLGRSGLRSGTKCPVWS